MKKKEFVLGTAQIGFDYGIANEMGKLNKEDSFKIIRYALDNRVNYFDTAYFYRDSEMRLGDYLRENSPLKNKMNIVTKMKPLWGEELDVESIRRRLDESLKKLEQLSIYGYLAHDFNDVRRNCDKMNKLFAKFKEEGLIEKIGASCTSEEDIQFLLDNFDVDIIQAPINIFHQKLYRSNIFKELRKRKIESHIRSVFSQGLLFLNRGSDKVQRKTNRPGLGPVDPDNKYEKCVKKLDIVCKQFGFSRSDIALLFVNDIEEIDKIVIGVEKVEQLKSNIESLSDDKIKIFNEVKNYVNWNSYYIRDKNVVDIRNWK